MTQPSYLEAHSCGILRVASNTDPKKLANAIYRTALNPEYDGRLMVRASGMSAVNAMLKACIIANGLVAQRGKSFIFTPMFDTAPDEQGVNLAVGGDFTITVIVMHCVLKPISALEKLHERIPA